INSKNTHGTGCTLSSAIAAHLALGNDLISAVGQSKEYLTKAIDNSISLGHEAGPVHHFHKFYSTDG
ncbi:MAG TPA: bifunctional hydroxymethylpyrimidine kinase/phosphomethylpyrimidine kinase, partial [Syntrophomonas sp.]|nr:bifunctional hydroxymethylpyrimidine kinase/phosphomethylpyrimidine kinase [Syntrophomonas sp.]